MQCAYEAYLVMHGNDVRKKTKVGDFELNFSKLFEDREQLFERIVTTIEKKYSIESKEEYELRKKQYTQIAKWTHGAFLGVAIPHDLPPGTIVQLSPLKPKQRGNNGEIEQKDKPTTG